MRIFRNVTSFASELDSYTVNEKYLFTSKQGKDDQYDSDLTAVLKAIDRINTIRDHQSALDGKELSEIQVPEVFSKLILPTAVYVDTTDEFCEDLLVRDDDTEAIDWDSFRSSCKAVVAKFRNGKVWKFVPLNQLKKVQSLNDVLGSMEVGNKVHLNGKWNWNPIPIKAEMANLYYENYFNEDIDDYLARYIKEVVVPYWRGREQLEEE